MQDTEFSQTAEFCCQMAISSTLHETSAIEPRSSRWNTVGNLHILKGLLDGCTSSTGLQLFGKAPRPE